jgi:peroxiredoxin
MRRILIATVLAALSIAAAFPEAPDGDVVLIPSSLKPGDRAPMFELPDGNGDMVRLEALLKDGPVVVFFYRGAWCPFCTKAHAKMAAALPEIRALGATVVAISPQTQEYTRQTAEKNELPYITLSDSGLTVARQFGLDFELKPETVKAYKGYGVDLATYNGSNKWELNVPGYYVIDTNGVIAWAYANEDYKVRPEPEMIISALRELQEH